MAVESNSVKQGVHVCDLGFAYPGEPPVLEHLSFEVPAGARVLLAGATGSGKSTLLRCLKPELTPEGTLTGTVSIKGQNVRTLDAQASAAQVGFVLQDPHQQIVMDTVRAELAFGLENLGIPSETIQRRVAEIAHFFGINTWIDCSTAELSGGEKQTVNLAAIIAMQPHILLLDEPTAHLDPLAARDFIDLVERVNDELGITVVLVEHQQEDLLARMNQVLYLDKGQLAFKGEPRAFARWLQSTQPNQKAALSVAAQLYFSEMVSEQSSTDEVPLDVREGRWWVWQHAAELSAALEQNEVLAESVVSAKGAPVATASATPCAAPLIETKHLWYRYHKEGPPVIEDLSLCINRGRILGIVGANASGKSTLLSLLAGTLKPQHGKVLGADSLQIGVLPQDPTSLFLRDTVQEDLFSLARDFGFDQQRLDELLLQMGLQELKYRHPFDLSGGEQQKLALAKLLLTEPDVLLLDEPTNGLDAEALGQLALLLKDECRRGTTIVLVSHHLEFVAATADECLMLFAGNAAGRAPVDAFFEDNMFYTTALRRITQGILEHCPPVLGRLNRLPKSSLEKVTQNTVSRNSSRPLQGKPSEKDKGSFS